MLVVRPNGMEAVQEMGELMVEMQAMYVLEEQHFQTGLLLPEAVAVPVVITGDAHQVLDMEAVEQLLELTLLEAPVVEVIVSVEQVEEIQAVQVVAPTMVAAVAAADLLPEVLEQTQLAVGDKQEVVLWVQEELQVLRRVVVMLVAVAAVIMAAAEQLAQTVVVVEVVEDLLGQEP